MSIGVFRQAFVFNDARRSLREEAANRQSGSTRIEDSLCEWVEVSDTAASMVITELQKRIRPR